MESNTIIKLKVATAWEDVMGIPSIYMWIIMGLLYIHLSLKELLHKILQFI
jgi:hypothetical protein